MPNQIKEGKKAAAAMVSRGMHLGDALGYCRKQNEIAAYAREQGEQFAYTHVRGAVIVYGWKG